MCLRQTHGRRFGRQASQALRLNASLATARVIDSVRRTDELLFSKVVLNLDWNR
jgi:hypothetical protein